MTKRIKQNAIRILRVKQYNVHKYEHGVCTMHLDSLHVRINIISELFILVEKIKVFNFRLHSSNIIVILRYYYKYN